MPPGLLAPGAGDAPPVADLGGVTVTDRLRHGEAADDLVGEAVGAMAWKPAWRSVKRVIGGGENGHSGMAASSFAGNVASGRRVRAAELDEPDFCIARRPDALSTLVGTARRRLGMGYEITDPPDVRHLPQDRCGGRLAGPDAPPRPAPAGEHVDDARESAERQASGSVRSFGDDRRRQGPQVRRGEPAARPSPVDQNPGVGERVPGAPGGDGSHHETQAGSHWIPRNTGGAWAGARWNGDGTPRAWACDQFPC